MKSVISVIQPFDFGQKIYMFEDGDIILDVSVPMSDLPDRIVQICYQDEVIDVNLRGQIDYIAKLKEDIRARELALYEKKNLEITLNQTKGDKRMQGYLISVTEVWRVEDNDAADAMEEEFRADETYELTKITKADKLIRRRGEEPEPYVQVNVTKVFNNAKEPESNVKPSYSQS